MRDDASTNLGQRPPQRPQRPMNGLTECIGFSGRRRVNPKHDSKSGQYDGDRDKRDCDYHFGPDCNQMLEAHGISAYSMPRPKVVTRSSLEQRV
jgi:hypothetical protein